MFSSVLIWHSVRSVMDKKDLVRLEIKFGPGSRGLTTLVPKDAKLYLVVFACFLSNINMGHVLGFSAILLPQLEQERNITTMETSLIASMSNVGQLASTFLTSFLANLVGRRWTLATFSCISASGFILSAVSAGNTAYLITARILQGASIVCSIAQVYISEIAPVDRRGFFGVFGTVGLSLGICLVYIYGATMSYVNAAFVCACFPIVCAISCLTFCPESPSWLLIKGLRSEAEESLLRLRGCDHNISAELDSLEEVILHSEKARSNGLLASIKELKRPEVMKACCLLIALMTLMMANGGTVIVFYAVNIIQDLNVLSNPYIPAILTGAVRLIGSVIGTIFVKRRWCGKKSLLTVTCFIMASAVALLGLQLKLTHYLEKQLGSGLILDLIPLILLTIFMINFGIGPATIPWSLQGELVPPKVSAFVTSISVFASISSLFVLTQIYPFMVSIISLPGTFWFYALVSLTMGLVSMIFLPETNGRSTKDVLDHFKADQGIANDAFEPDPDDKEFEKVTRI